MSKEEILKVAEQWLLKHPTLSFYDLESHDEGGYLGINENVLYQIMTEYADQEKEKVAVAFVEWLSKNCIQAPYGFSWRIYDPEEELWVYRNPSDLYKYFITNVYNK